jgi:Transcriptional regulator
MCRISHVSVDSVAISLRFCREELAVPESQSGMQSGKTDRRIERTRECLWDALVQLIDERGYAGISVQDITERASVNRTTFYRHYEDKDDLFRQGSVDLCDSIIDSLRSLHAGESSGDVAWMPGYLERMFVCIAEDREDFRALAGSKSNPEFRRIIEDKVEAYLKAERLPLWISPAAIDSDPTIADVYACAATSLLIGLASWWVLSPEPVSAERIAKVYASLIVGGIKGLFLPPA